MADYTRTIDAEISRLLRQHGAVTPDMMAGLNRDAASAMLARYVEVHAHEVEFVFDGERLTWASASRPAPDYPPYDSLGATYVPPSPVDQVLAAPTGKSLLDTKPSGGSYPRRAWWLSITFGVIGGLIAWWWVKDDNPRVAVRMLVLGVVISVVYVCSGVGAAILLMPGVVDDSSAWPASVSARPVFYYFGTST